MDLQLSGKRALVSAGHKGIGKIVATRLLEEGASVSICCRRSDELDEALADLSSLGTALGQVRDMSDPDARRGVGELVDRGVGRPRPTDLRPDQARGTSRHRLTGELPVMPPGA